MRLLLTALLLALVPGRLLAQEPELDRAAEQARRAWNAHDAKALVAESPRLLEQAAALLSDFMVQGEEVETLVRAAREVETGRGYVELQRRYRVAGTQDVRQQSLLLGYKLGKEGWRLVELRVVG